MFSLLDPLGPLATSAVLCPLPQWGLIAVTGTKAADFLQGQISCDVKALDDSNSSLGVHCNPKGRILVSFRIFKREGLYYLLLPLTMIASTCQTLKKYAQFFKVELTDLSATWCCMGLAGAHSPQLLQKLAGHEITLIDIPGSPPRFILLGLSAAVAKLPALLNPPLQITEPELWDYLDIAAGIAHILPATQALLTPHQMNYQLIEGICFTKGCYTGQEIIARMQYLGKLKQHLYRIALTAATPPQLGEVILYAEQNVGEIVNICALGGSQYEALAVLKDEMSQHPDLVLAQSQGQVTALLALPYSLPT